MSLRTAIESIVEEMEKANRADVYMSLLDYYAKQIRLALKASEGEDASRIDKTGVVSLPDGTQGYHDPLGRFHALKRDSEDPKDVVKEDGGGRATEVIGGGMDGTMLPVPADLADLSKTVLNGEVYVFHKLVNTVEFSEEETVKLNKSKIIVQGEK